MKVGVGENPMPIIHLTYSFNISVVFSQSHIGLIIVLRTAEFPRVYFYYTFSPRSPSKALTFKFGLKVSHNQLKQGYFYSLEMENRNQNEISL